MAAPVADTKKALDDAFTDAIKKINELITATTALKDAYGKKPAATTEELKLLKDTKQALSAEVQAKLADINRRLGVSAPAEAAAAPATATAPARADQPAQKVADIAAAATEVPKGPIDLGEGRTTTGRGGGGRKPAKKTAGKPKRAQKGGSDAAIAPSDAVPTSVYNIQGLMTQNHNPYLVASDANIAAMSRIHAPFSAGVVGDVNQQTTAELSTALVGRMTPQPPMAGGAKRKSAKTGAAKKK
jgi:hypothetical protein